MKKAFLILAIIAIALPICATRCQAGTKYIAPHQDTILFNQLHVEVDADTIVYGQDTISNIAYMTCDIHTGTTGWVEVSVWLYDKGGNRLDMNKIDLYLRGDDYDNFRKYWLAYAYWYAAEQLNLEILDN